MYIAGISPTLYSCTTIQGCFEILKLVEYSQKSGQVLCDSVFRLDTHGLQGNADYLHREETPCFSTLHISGNE